MQSAEERRIFAVQFGSEMRRARKQLGMTQSELATRMQLCGIDISEDRIRKLETGNLRMGVDEAFVIAHILFLDLNRRAEIFVDRIMI